ncbi:nuclear transport factor 2 family protein [Thalassotalea sp. 1_MG-2023]|uniref:nuclear transport factor 2 family protein n=1 Tax=Thalassotalea sp. 1_MG-2023 TaxID=3062680 RepID=UPI0026E278E5|nr:nuclear transport factor 2 family protein [Thalassotalea sp. 1_MG-2023]MDO6425430.1 nuclear transport factor 2 family protein [Thalassotalea sp. 1_MG-2023]
MTTIYKGIWLTGLLLTITLLSMFKANATELKYFSSLRYNHVSLHAGTKGILPISEQQAAKQRHYVFKYNEVGKLIEIINNTYQNVKLHPLTHFGAKRVKIDYAKGRKTFTFYDINDRRMLNIRGVFKEVYRIDDTGFVEQLNFYDADDKAMESRWNIAEYRWHKHNNLVIEQRFNAAGVKQPLSPYFHFNDTAIEYDEIGNPYRHYNIDEKFNIVPNSNGMAYYQDSYDEQGLHTKYAYYDQHYQLTLNAWGFAYAIKQYDTQGQYTGRTKYGLQDQAIANLYPTVKKDNRKDADKIKQVSLSYLKALQSLDPELMKTVIHPELSKHTVPPFPAPNGKISLRETSYKRLIEHAEHWNKSGMKFPPVTNNNVTILDQHNNIATVKMVSDNWIEYIHLVKLNGKWQIKNLLWDYNRE